MMYDTLRKQTAIGYNTWDTTSVLSHVLLPYGLSIRLGFKDYVTGRVFRNVLIGDAIDGKELIHPGIRTYGGGYTELAFHHGSVHVRIQSAAVEDEQYLLITPLEFPEQDTVVRSPALVADLCMLWNRPGRVCREGNQLKAELADREITFSATGRLLDEYYTFSTNPYLALELSGPIAISTAACSLEEVQKVIETARAKTEESAAKYGDQAECYAAMRTCLAWDTIYDPEHDRICSPVSRNWNVRWGGYVLFCWDTFFAAAMAAVENKELAYMNILAILEEMTENGFVPNFGAAYDYKSRDRSQPPVGSIVIREVYDRYREKWLLEETFDRLFGWNTWFTNERTNADGTLSWGSNLYQPRIGKHWERFAIHNRDGAAFESGLDNSPMYDGVPFNPDTNCLYLADVGLTGLYIADCEDLAYLAAEIGRTEEQQVLLQRAQHAKDGMATLWSEQDGIFLNRRTDTGEFSRRLSPTNFYALFSDRVSDEQATRMVKEHMFNPEEFWGDYVLPSIARNDPAFPDQNYWRGRVWGPLNYLVYLALCRQNQPEARTALAEKSADLLLKEWRLHGHVHENYDSTTGMGCGVHNSDKFYHWGALLALIGVLESEQPNA